MVPRGEYVVDRGSDLSCQSGVLGREDSNSQFLNAFRCLQLGDDTMDLRMCESA